jgi:TolB protein
MMPREGGTPRRLTSSSAIDTEAVYSPDGRSVYFVSDRGGGPQIYRVPAAGGNAERVTFSRQLQHQPGHQPRRQAAGLRQPPGQRFPLMTLDLEAGSVRTLTDTRTTRARALRPTAACWSTPRASRAATC